MFNYAAALMKGLITDGVTDTVSGSHMGTLFATKVGLVNSAAGMGANPVLADLTECTFTDYARKTNTFGLPYQVPDGSYEVAGSLLQFQPTHAVTVAESVYGYFLVDAATGLILLGVELFPAPIPIASEDNALILVPIVGLGNGNWGTCLVLNPAP